MDYLFMRPEQIREAVKRQVPVVIVAGAVEFHGAHEPIGTDFLIPRAVMKRVEKRCEVILMPGLPFAPTMFWAGGAADGEFNFNPGILENYAKEIFRGIAEIGFRRIYILQHHQSGEDLPCLCLKKAAKEVIFDFASKQYHGWGRQDDYITENLFLMFKVAHIDTFSEYEPGQKRCPIGHGGKGETQLVLGQWPEAVDMGRLSYFEENNLHFPRWLKDSDQATFEEGNYWLDFCADGWVKELSKPYTSVGSPKSEHVKKSL